MDVVSILDRLKDTQGYETDSQLCRWLEVSSSRLAGWKRRNSLDLELVLTKCKGTNIDLNWILNGEETISQKINTLQAPTILTVTLDSTGNENIVLVNSKAAAGYPMNIGEPEYFRDLPIFNLPGYRFRNGSYRCFEVEGDSMSNTIYHGDWVVAKFLDSWPTQIQDGYIHVVVTKDSLLVKRCLNRVAERGALVLQSDNSEYPTFQIEASEIQEVWRVGAKIGFNLPNTSSDLRLRVMELEGRVSALEAEKI